MFSHNAQRHIQTDDSIMAIVDGRLKINKNEGLLM